MKWIIPILILFSFPCKSQLNTLTKKELEMDSISMSKFDLHFKLPAIQHYKGYRPTPKIKFTFKSKPNLNISDSASVGQIVQEIEDNLIGVMKYDIRCKVYLTKKFSLIGRALIDNGTQFNADTYSIGLIGKF